LVDPVFAVGVHGVSGLDTGSLLSLRDRLDGDPAEWGQVGVSDGIGWRCWAAVAAVWM
jgi:hypothetical protein